MKVLATLTVSASLLLAAPKTADADQGTASVTRAICQVFGPYCSQALRVAWCESRYQTTARNGSYLGLFQMGSYARARYGHGADAWTQARAAYRYFRDAGYSWSPWACKP